MNKRLLIHLAFISLPFGTYLQIAPTLDWENCFGGIDRESPNCIRQTSDGGFIVAGFAKSYDGNVTGLHGNSDGWIVKLTANGLIEWQKCLGGSNADVAGSILQTTDGAYMVAGSTNSANGDVTNPKGNKDFWLIKLAANGDLLWQKTYGGSDDEEATGIVPATDGGYVLAGYTQSPDGQVTGLHSPGKYDAWIIKVNSNGDLQWQKTLGGEDYDHCTDLKQTTDGGYILANYTLSAGGQITQTFGGGDFWIVKLDSLGNLTWQKTFGGSNWDVPCSILQLQDGNYLVSGYTESTDGDVTNHHGQRDAWVLKLNGSGNLTWQSCFGGTYREAANSIVETPEGGFAFAGYTNSNDSNSNGLHGAPGTILGGDMIPDYWIVKCNPAGQIEWEKLAGGFYNDRATCMLLGANNELVIGGFVYGNTDSSGDINGFHVNNSLPAASGSDFWIVQLAPLALGITQAEKNSVTVFPNPADQFIHLKSNDSLKPEAVLTDLLGKSVVITMNNQVIPLSGLTPGMYFLKTCGENGESFSTKIIKE